MANFLPLKRYILFCIDKLIDKYNLIPPFLDVGCGNAYASVHVAGRGWHGKAIDISAQAIEVSRQTLFGYANIQLEKKSLFEEQGSYNTLLLLDILEHLPDERQVLEKACALLSSGGYLLLSLPSNPREWRWDDEFYGHYRRYTPSHINELLNASGFTPLIMWDISYPVFWLMRRCYLRFNPVQRINPDKYASTLASSCHNAYVLSSPVKTLAKATKLWNIVYRLQFACCRNFLNRGYELIILAQKTEISTLLAKAGAGSVKN